MTNKFEPYHINATEEDLAGNNGIGRYILMPGSNGRAKEISQHFNNLVIKEHSRGHHLYLGELISDGQVVDVATIASGMGCPSMEIILHELFHLGAKRFLRVGTAGSLQANIIKLGDFVNAHGSVRDENTTTDYVPISVPAISSFEFTNPILLAANKLGLSDNVHTGMVHCKSSFYAREFGVGPRGNENKEYINILSQCGVLASEMETASLFIQSQLYNHQLRQQGKGPQYQVLAGAILGIISVPPKHFASSLQTDVITANLVKLAIETIKILCLTEMNDSSN